MLLQMAADPAAGASTRPAWVLPLVIGSGLLLAAGIGLALWWLLVYRKRQQAAQPTPPTKGIDAKRLSSIWDKFMENLPSLARPAVAEYSHFMVMGQAASGKSSLIQRKVDWQGQASQFLPSYTADPILQIYLGPKMVVQELSGPLLESTSRATNDALKRLFGKLDLDAPPTVVLVLKVSSLTTMTPDQLRQQAQLMRGKINLLSQQFNTPIPTRVCLTNMDRTHGYGDVARFLKRNKIPLELPIGADAGLTASLQAYEKYLPRALTTLPVGPFQSNVEFLLSAEDILGPVRNFIQALLEGSLTSARPELQKLYFFSPAPDEQVGNPFDTPAKPPEPSRKLAWFRRWLASLGIRPLHALLGGLLLLAGLTTLWVVTRRHAQLVDNALDTTAALDASVRRAQETRSAPSESEAVRRNEREAAKALGLVRDAEGRFRPLRLLFRRDKNLSEQRFVDAVRAGYLLPELDRSVRQRSRERILYALVAVYATNHNTLGAMVRAQPAAFSQTIDVSSDILLDYVRYSEEPWRDLALRLLPALPNESSRWPVNDLGPWREFVRAIIRALPLPYITAAQLKVFQNDADRLWEALVQVRKAATLRQLFRALAEESPLDMVHLFGRDAGALVPNTWIVDNAEPLDQLLTLVRESSLQYSGSGRMSLFRLLKWINELNNRLGSDAKDQSKQFEEVIYHFPFPDEKPSEVSRRAWIELLLRSRKRLLLAYQVSSVASTHRRPPRTKSGACCGNCEAPKKKRAQRNNSCPVNGSDSDDSSSEGPRANSGSGSDDSAEDRPGPRHSGRRRISKMPLWNEDEFTPKLAALMNSNDTPDSNLSDVYNRVVLEKEVMPLIQELKRALANSKSLTPDEKVRLSRLVQEEVGIFARAYCGTLRRFYLSYRFGARSGESLHTELLNLMNPGSTFLSHLRTFADNAQVSGLDEPYLRSLSQCLAELQPVVQLIYPPESAGAPAAKADDKGAKPDDKGAKPDDKKAEDKPAPKRRGGIGVPEGLQGYKAAITKLISDLDGVGQSGGQAEKSPLAERLSPLGKTALASTEGKSDTPLHMAEKFLDEAGVSGDLRGPFLSPFNVAHRQGINDIERVMAQHWRDELLPMVSPLFSRFPFNRAAEREVAPAELDALNEAKGTFWQDLKNFYAPVLVDRGGTYQQRPVPGTSLDLPPNMLDTVNRLTKLSRALFRPDGSRQPLKLSIRGLPGRALQEERTVQGTTGFLQVGKSAAYGFNQNPSAVPISVDWWDQGVAVVGLESTTTRTGRRQTQSIEVADSSWSLFRLLQKSTLESDGISTWRIVGDGPAESQSLRFVIQPDPWSLFQVQLQ